MSCGIKQAPGNWVNGIFSILCDDMHFLMHFRIKQIQTTMCLYCIHYFVTNTDTNLLFFYYFCLDLIMAYVMIMHADCVPHVIPATFCIRILYSKQRCHFQSFHSILVASVQFKYKKIMTYEEFSPNMCIIYLFQHVTF